MSRGHGKWERAILEVLEQAEEFYLLDLLDRLTTQDWWNPRASHTRLVALRRAAHSLHDAGKVRCFYDDAANGRLVVARVDLRT